jgi:hypothetical protein
MSDQALHLTLMAEGLAVCRLGSAAPIPDWVLGSSFHSITRTADELSVVVPEACVPDEIRAEKGWRCLKVAGPLDFGMVGVLSSLAGPLAEAKVSIFAISTFDTDYLLVQADQLSRGTDALRDAGHRID